MPCGTVRRFALCCTGRRLTPPRCYLALCPVEPGLSSISCETAIVWPTPATRVTASRITHNTGQREGLKYSCTFALGQTLTPLDLPRWRPAQSLSHADCSLALRSWLLDRGSLTARLRGQAGDSFRVTVLRQGWAKPRLDEAEVLAIPLHQRALIREVILWGQEQPWVYARSVIPLAVLQGSLGFLRKLDNRPLGQLLFNNPQIRRGPIDIARWSTHWLPSTLQTASTTPLWARRSVFHYRDSGILVAELFLPNIQEIV